MKVFNKYNTNAYLCEIWKLIVFVTDQDFSDLRQDSSPQVVGVLWENPLILIAVLICQVIFLGGHEQDITGTVLLLIFLKHSLNLIDRKASVPKKIQPKCNKCHKNLDFFTIPQQNL